MRRSLFVLAESVVHASSAIVVVALLVAVGQPIFTDDLWWHLAMGGQYAEHGPWLAADPFLFGAASPPDPAAWLTDLLFHGVHRVGGFQSLRVLHVVVVAAILALGWSMLRRVGDSRVFASLGTSVFALLGAYRFFQLRPDLFSILAALVLIHLLILDRRPPTRQRWIATAAVLGLWANLHAAFVLGLVFVAAAIAGAVVGAIAWAPDDPLRWSRVRGLSIAGGIGVVASWLNPSGPRLLTLFFVAGTDTPELDVVVDEWAPVALFARPLLNVPPTPLDFALVWILLIATPLVGIALLRARARRDAGDRRAIVAAVDPALWAVAAASLIGMVSAVRLLWLGFFALLAIGQAARVLIGGPRRPAIARTAAAVCSLALVPGFFQFGDWSMISQALDRSSYAQPYSTAKYNAHGVWFLRDSGLEGRLYNDYWIGNFLSYWLTPELQMFVNGSLNIPTAMMAAGQDIRARRVDAAGRTPEQLLDLYEVDVFLGTGVPVAPRRGRPAPDTTHHLEGAVGWLPVFRNMQTSVHLRQSEDNQRNLERITAYYRDRGVPFDPEVGFDPAAVVREAPEWAIAHGLLPVDFRALEEAARRESGTARMAARDRLASLYVLIGLYDDALAIDERLVATMPNPLAAERRRVWSLLHTGRIDEAVAVADRLQRLALPNDGWSRRMVALSHRFESLSEAERAEALAVLPLFNRPQGQRAASGFLAAEPRPGRDRRDLAR